MPSDNISRRSTGNKKKRAEAVIRLMEIDDISTVYHLGERLFTSEEFPILYRTWDPYEVSIHFTTDPDYCLVAEADGKVAGFIMGTTIEKEGTAWKKYGYISWIGVDEAFQRSNLGHRLYRKLEVRLRKDGVRMMIVDTEADNQEAIAFFQDMGFSLSSEYVWLAKTLRRRGKKEAESEKAASLSVRSTRRYSRRR
jgi:ribosomal protein S18 acetylase RimI-like enzyme